MCQRTRSGVGGRSGCHTTRLRQRSLDRPSCLPVTASAVGLERRRAADLWLTALRPCVRRADQPTLAVHSSAHPVQSGRTYVQGPPRLRAIIPWSIRPCGRLTDRVDELSAPPTLAASSSHSPTGPPLATEPFLCLFSRGPILKSS